MYISIIRGGEVVLVSHSKMSLLKLVICRRRFVENSVSNLWFGTCSNAKSHGEKSIISGHEFCSYRRLEPVIKTCRSTSINLWCR